MILNALSRRLSNKTIIANAPPNSTIPQNGSSRSRSNIGAIVGGVVGGVTVIAISVAVLLILRKRRRRRYEKSEAVGPAWHHPRGPSYRPYRTADTSDDVRVDPYPDMTTDGPHTSSTIMAVVGDAHERAPMRPSHGLSSKLSGVPPHRTHRTSPSAATPASSQTVSAFRSAASDSASLSTTEVVGLRTEVENLRRVMHEIRSRQYEPPPEYVEQ